MYPQSTENLALLNKVIEAGYGGIGSPQGLAGVKDLAKADAPILSTTTGFFNATFGASVFQQLNTASVLAGALPKFPYQRAGYRAQTTRFLDSGLGAAENGDLPYTIKPTQAPVTVGIKEQVITFEYSERERLLAGTKDDVGFDATAMLERAKESFAYAFDADLNTLCTTLAGNNVESIDRVVSSYAEVTNCSDITAGDSDIYALNRDAAATWADAYVNHNSGTPRALSTSLIRKLIRYTTKAGANPRGQFFYMGEDAYEQIIGLNESQMRYTNPDAFQPAKTNINTGETGGINYGQEMGTLYGRPVLVAASDKVPTSGTGTISNIYLLDTSYDPLYGEPILGLKVLQAPIIAETNLAQFPVHKKLGNERLLYSAMELECKRFNVQGKIRDLLPAV